MTPYDDRRWAFALAALLLLLCAQGVGAIRASPAQVILPLGSDGAFAVRALDESDPSRITLRIEGDLATLVSLGEPTADPDGGVLITGHVAIPADLAPGDHAQQLIIGTALSRGQETVAARAEIAVPIIVRMPYPEAYLVANWDAQPDESGRGSHITLTLENRGRVPVTPQRVLLRFSDAGGSLPELDIPAAAVMPGAFLRHEATYTLRAGATPGIYLASLSVLYADTELTDAKEVPVGSPAIAIDAVTYDTAERGAIVPIDVSGTVGWNRPIAGGIDVSFDDHDVVVAHADVADIHGTFTTRLYADTAAVGIPNGSVRAVVRVAESHAERIDTLRAGGATATNAPTWMLWTVGSLAVIIAILLLLMLLRWRRLGRPPRPTTIARTGAQAPPAVDPPKETFISQHGGGDANGMLASTENRRS